MTTGPDIYDPYRRQVNTYGEISVYKRDCAQIVPPNPDHPPKTD